MMCFARGGRRAQIGGLIVATFITLRLVPVIYAIFVLDLKLVKWDTIHKERIKVSATQSGECAFEASRLNIGYQRNKDLLQAKITEESNSWIWDITDDRYITVQHLGKEMTVYCLD